MKPDTTTVTVDRETQTELKKYCKRNCISQGEFIKTALDYFRKSGISPADPPQSVREELGKMDKRLNQVISFQRTFERENLLPLVVEVRKEREKIEQLLLNATSATPQPQPAAAGAGVNTAVLREIREELRRLDSIATLLENLISFIKNISYKVEDIYTLSNIIYKHGAGAGGLNNKTIKETYDKARQNG